MISLPFDATSLDVLDGHFLDLYAGSPATGLVLQSIQFHLSSPVLTFDVDPALTYTLVIRGAGGFELVMYPNAEPPTDKFFGPEFDESFD